MSATNRGGVRREADFYETPAWCVHRLIERVVLPGNKWLEPACGHGAVIRAVAKHHPGIIWTGYDIRDTSNHIRDILTESTLFKQCNFLDEPVNNIFNTIITNPPYSLAIDFVNKAFEYDATVALLLRANFLASATRHAFMRSHMPDQYLIPNRPSFTDDNKTDACEYAWMVWPRNQRNRNYGRVELLDLTPSEERRIKVVQSA